MHIFDVGVKYSVRIQPIGNEELVLASDATAWGDASLVLVISGGAFCFSFIGQRTCLCDFGNSLQ
jgi:hypothetical protein